MAPGFCKEPLMTFGILLLEGKVIECRHPLAIGRNFPPVVIIWLLTYLEVYLSIAPHVKKLRPLLVLRHHYQHFLQPHHLLVQRITLRYMGVVMMNLKAFTTGTLIRKTGSIGTLARTVTLCTTSMMVCSRITGSVSPPIMIIFT